MSKPFSQYEIRKIEEWMQLRNMPYIKVAELLGRSRHSIASFCQRNKITKKYPTCHSGKHRAVFLYAMEHTAAETCIEFKLKNHELKSILVHGYKHYNERKDKRYRHRQEWTPDELKAAISLAGIIRRDDIAKVVDRANGRTVKEKLAEFNVNQLINGLDIKRAKQIGYNLDYLTRDFVNVSGQQFVSWVQLENQSFGDPLDRYIKIMSRFQQWLLCVESNKQAIYKIKELMTKYQMTKYQRKKNE